MYWKRLATMALLILLPLYRNANPSLATPALAADIRNTYTSPLGVLDTPPPPDSTPTQGDATSDTTTPGDPVLTSGPDYSEAGVADSTSPYFCYLPLVSRQPRPQFYISTDGVDPSGCYGGTRSRPWRTWARAEKCIPPNAIVYFAAGDYSNVFSGSSHYKINFYGDPGQPIVIKPLPGAEGQVHFNRFIEIYGTYGILSGIDIDANSTYYVALTVYGSHIVLENNRIHGARQQGCVRIARGTHSVSVINNEIYDCGLDPTSQTDRGVALSTNGEANLFRGNHIHDARGAIQLKGGATDVLIENNRIDIQDERAAIYGCDMGSLSDPQPEHGNLRMHDPSVAIEERYQAKNVTIRNNLIYNTSGHSAISPRGWVNYYIYNNTILNQSGSMTFYVSSAGWEFFDSTALAYCATHRCSRCTSYQGTRDCVKIYLPTRVGEIKNNIIYGFHSILTVEPGNDSGLEIANNLYYAYGFARNTPNTYIFDGRGHSLATFQMLGYEAGSFVADPRFMDIANAADPDLRLQSTSPAIDRAVSLPGVDQDFAGTSRPQGPAPDLGAYEFLGLN